MAYDVIIAGGSFAGLAVASQLRGKILLIEADGIGKHQKIYRVFRIAELLVTIVPRCC